MEAMDAGRVVEVAVVSAFLAAADDGEAVIPEAVIRAAVAVDIPAVQVAAAIARARKAASPRNIRST